MTAASGCERHSIFLSLLLVAKLCSLPNCLPPPNKHTRDSMKVCFDSFSH
jgi:hypothetical protein